MRTASYFRQKKAFFFIYLLAKLMHHHYYNKYGISLPIGQKIGTPFMIGHIPGIIINGNATIGNNVLIMQNVTIGSTRGKGAPRIGNNILLCAGAKIVGNVSLGDNVVVGTNAVVVHCNTMSTKTPGKDMPDSRQLPPHPKVDIQAT